MCIEGSEAQNLKQEFLCPHTFSLPPKECLSSNSSCHVQVIHVSSPELRTAIPNHDQTHFHDFQTIIIHLSDIFVVCHVPSF